MYKLDKMKNVKWERICIPVKRYNIERIKQLMQILNMNGLNNKSKRMKLFTSKITNRHN